MPEHLRQHWGQLDEEEESESEEEVADPEALEEEEEYDAAGYTSVLTDQLGGIATPASMVDLRKGPDPEPGRQPAADGTLSSTHHPDQHDRPVAEGGDDAVLAVRMADHGRVRFWRFWRGQ